MVIRIVNDKNSYSILEANHFKFVSSYAEEKSSICMKKITCKFMIWFWEVVTFYSNKDMAAFSRTVPFIAITSHCCLELIVIRRSSLHERRYTVRER